MKGDFTRFTFASGKHYDAVLTQQGRVQTDADWNEQVQITAHRTRTAALDIIGPTGAPQDISSGGQGAFVVYWGPDGQGTDQLFINQGRYYVDGVLVENEAPVPFTGQPGAMLPPVGGAGIHLLYLDVWRRHITSLEDPDIREVALAGADSGTRSQIVWQVRAVKVGNLGDDIDAIPAADFEHPWQPAGTESTGMLDAQAGSTPLENQLYRVEIHRGGAAGVASCKWSRDNGTVVARILTNTPPVETQMMQDGVLVDVWRFSIDIDRSGRDSFSSFLPGQMVELSNDQHFLQRAPGVFGRIIGVVGDTLTLEVPTVFGKLDAAGPGAENVNPLLGTTRTVRRWDNPWNPDLADTTLLDVGPDYTTPDGRLILERDISVSFASGGGEVYQAGDYWLIPARTASGLVDWVVNEPQPAAGEEHSYAPLALVRVQANGTVASPATDIRDIRRVFPTLRSLGGSGGGIVTGTPTQNYVAKWLSANTSELTSSTIIDNGASVTIGAGAVHAQGTLQVGTAADSQVILRFSDAPFPIVVDAQESQVVPTRQAVAGHVAQQLQNFATILASTAVGSPGAGLIGVADAGGKLDATNVEAALAELVEAFEANHFRGNEASAGQHRTITQPSLGGSKALLLDSSASGNSLSRFRIYADSSSIWFIVNASWSEANSEWVAGGFGNQAAGGLRISRNEIELLHREPGIGGFATFPRRWRLPMSAHDPGNPASPANSAFELSGDVKEVGRIGLDFTNADSVARFLLFGGAATFRNRFPASPSSITFSPIQQSASFPGNPSLWQVDRDGFGYYRGISLSGLENAYWHGTYTAIS